MHLISWDSDGDAGTGLWAEEVNSDQIRLLRCVQSHIADKAREPELLVLSKSELLTITAWIMKRGLRPQPPRGGEM